MGASGFISSRIRFKGKLAALAIAVSFLIIIIAVAVSAGFRKEIRAGVSELTGDVIISGPSFNYYSDEDPVSLDHSCLQEIRKISYVRELRPVVYRAGIVRAGGDIQGVMVKGVESTDSSMHVRIPERLAAKLKLSKGDEMVTCFVSEKVKVRKFVVEDIYESILETDGNLVVYAPIQDLRRLNGWDDETASAIEITLDGNRNDRASLREAANEIGSACLMYCGENEDSLLATSAGDKYSQLFDWLGLIDFNVAAILLLMTVVAGFNMISGLLILLFRHISTIGTLKALGMGNAGISAVFVKVSARLALTGMVAGNAIGLLFCLVQDKTHLIKLNPENYFVSFVPVSVNVPALLLADAVAFAAILLLTLLPCLFISKIDPSETVKTE